jgi:hypothetical protein
MFATGGANNGTWVRVGPAVEGDLGGDRCALPTSVGGPVRSGREGGPTGATR